MQILDAIAVLKEFGFAVIAKLLLTIGWFAAPFCLWAAIDKLTGEGFFILTVAIPGALLMLALFIWLAAQIYFTTCFEFGLMKRVEHCGRIFQNPSDPDVRKQYSEECEKLVLPYVYRYPITAAGRMSDVLASAPMTVISQTVNLYLSYSMFTLLVLYQAPSRALVAPVMTVPQISSLVTTVLPWAYDNPMCILILLGIVSLYVDIRRTTTPMRALGSPLHKMVLI